MHPHRFVARNRTRVGQPGSSSNDRDQGPNEAAPGGAATGADPDAPLGREMDELWAGPSIGVMTETQLRGLIIGAIVGAIIGAVLLQPLALVHIAGLGPLLRMLVVGVVGALAGGTAGALYLGGHLPEVEGEVPPEARSDDVGRAKPS